MFCYQENFFAGTRPVDEEQFRSLVSATKWRATIEEYRKTGDASLKRKLPAFIFQARFDETVSKKGKRGQWRKQSAARLTGLVVMDIDHVDDPCAIYMMWKEKHDFVALGILLVYVTPSGKGLKVVFKADAEKGNLIDNQHCMARVLGVEVDEACKDASRMSFICRVEDVLYLSKELFTYENREFAARYEGDYREGRSQATREHEVREVTEEVAKSPVTNDTASAPNPNTTAASSSDQTVSDLNFKGIPYATIIAKWWEKQGGVPKEGERNVKLYQLAVALRAICDNSREVLKKIVPRLGLDEAEVDGIVASACKEAPRGVSKVMREILDECEIDDDDDERMHRCLHYWGGRLEELAEHFPVLKDVCKGLKEDQRAAAFIVAGGLLMTLMTRCWYRFYHRAEEKRRLNCSALIIGDPASGKSFAARLYRLLTAPIAFADKRGLDAINAYREELRTKGANKEKPKKPKVTVRLHPSRTSNAQFIQDMVNAVEVVDGEEVQLHMLTFDTELDNTLSLQKGGSWIDKMSMELKAFHNEEDGQAYSNADSVMQNFFVTWNYIYTGTPLALRKKVTDANFGSGLATRLTCVPLPSTGFEMIKREAGFDTRSDERLKEWAWRLDRTKGELPLAKLVDALYDMTARRMEDAKENDSKADEMLLKRVAYHALNFSAPFIVMRHWEEMRNDGDKFVCAFETDEVDRELCEMVFNMQYVCQRHFFGKLAENYFKNRHNESASCTRRWRKTEQNFNKLPDEFTAEDVARCFNLKDVKSARVRICRFVQDRVVEVAERGDEVWYRKTGYVTT